MLRHFPSLLLEPLFDHVGWFHIVMKNDDMKAMLSFWLEMLLHYTASLCPACCSNEPRWSSHPWEGSPRTGHLWHPRRQLLQFCIQSGMFWTSLLAGSLCISIACCLSMFEVASPVTFCFRNALLVDFCSIRCCKHQPICKHFP